MKNVLAAVFLAMILGVGSTALHIAATGNDTLETTTATATAAIRTSPPPAALPAKGSSAFSAALALLDADPLAAFAAAATLPDAVERHTVQWAAVFKAPGAIAHADVKRLAAEAPAFASAEFFETRLEQSLVREAPAASEVVATMADRSASTVDGQIMLAGARLATGDKDGARHLARQIWTENFLSTAQEAKVLARFGSLLDRDAHWQRAMHLMMHDRAKGSERLLPFLSDAQKSLVVARAAVSRDAPNAKALLDKVDASLVANPVFIFSRAQRARQFGLWDDAVAWLDKAKGELPDAAEWWYERRTLVRKLLDEGKPDLAFRAAAGFREGPEARLVDAHFHAGWIALSFLNDAAAARDQFTAMSAHTTLPDSISQAHYWLGRANLKLGDMAAARLAFETAARFHTVYYGQLARTELGEASTAIRPAPAWQDSAPLFKRNSVVRAVRLLAANNKRSLSLTLLRQFGTTRTVPGEFLLAARLAQELDAHHLAIAIAAVADSKGVALDTFGFPKAGVPDDAPLAADRAAVYAIARQESMFQIDAVSSAGARGLMQLMPGTAKEVAGKVGVAYSPNRLVTDPAYNALLGSTYLGAQLDRYDGSLVLAAAAYNAGPGNANKWIKAYGDPRVGNVDPVIWVELIPFQETRTYVKRVLGNYLVYRARLGETPMTLKQALRSID